MLATLSYYAQRYGLSATFFYFAWSRAGWVFDGPTRERVLAPLVAGGLGRPGGLEALTVISRTGLLAAFNILVGTLLLANRRPDHPPARVSHVLVPLFATFAYLGYVFVAYLPASLRRPLVPTLGVLGVLIAGVLVVAAYAISFAALLYLRRSFAVFVEVRDGVMVGPYRFVRHPMYLGYIFIVVAFLLVQPSAGTIAVSIFLLAIMFFRARLEEQMLKEHVPRYAEYAKRTGMLFPMPWRAAGRRGDRDR